ncbi:MAG: restriction endonuclease subunit S, partial [Mailhella sp.]|nr:restriction endonuclease subunit S [Mailhella sp.]
MTAEQLKASVLQMAIEGKLVPQLDDEPAVDIEAVEPEEVHFAIPEKWKWVTLEKLFNFVDYRGKTPIKSPSGVRLMTASNVRKGYIDHTRMEFISKEEFATRQSRGISAKGDILFTTEAPLGNAALADLEEYSAGQRVITLQSDTVNKQLYVYFLISPYFQKTLAENATGTTAQGIKAAKLKKLSLPLPPIAEQDRIVTLLNEILPLIEEYGKAHSALKNAEEALPAQLRASFLQEAIQGKLVPQLDDEPAVEIAGEEPEEVPFAIPEKWKWVKLEDICLYIQRGKSPKYSDIQQYPVVSQKCNQWDGFHIEKAKFIQPETIAKYEEKRILRDGDLLWNSTGTGTLGRVAEYQ